MASSITCFRLTAANRLPTLSTEGNNQEILFALSHVFLGLRDSIDWTLSLANPNNSCYAHHHVESVKARRTMISKCEHHDSRLVDRELIGLINLICHFIGCDKSPLFAWHFLCWLLLVVVVWWYYSFLATWNEARRLSKRWPNDESIIFCPIDKLPRVQGSYCRYHVDMMPKDIHVSIESWPSVTVKQAAKN